jgi:hypothetical protein
MKQTAMKDQLRIHLSTVTHGDVLEAELPYISVRFNAVEEMVATLEDPHPLLTPADIAVRATLTVPTSSSGGFVRKTWVIRSPDDVTSAAEQIATQAIEKGIPVFETLSNAEQALAILSADNERSRSYAAPDETRAKKVGLSRACGNNPRVSSFTRHLGAAPPASAFTLWRNRLSAAAFSERMRTAVRARASTWSGRHNILNAHKATVLRLPTEDCAHWHRPSDLAAYPRSKFPPAVLPPQRTPGRGKSGTTTAYPAFAKGQTVFSLANCDVTLIMPL